MFSYIFFRSTHNLYSRREKCYHCQTALTKYLQYLEFITPAFAPRTCCWNRQHVKRTFHTEVIYLWRWNTHCCIHLCSKGDWVTLASLKISLEIWKNSWGCLYIAIKKGLRITLNFVGLGNPIKLLPLPTTGVRGVLTVSTSLHWVTRSFWQHYR